MSEHVVEIEGLWKQYGFPLRALVERLMPPFMRRGAGVDEGRWALRGIDVAVRRGETLGLIGRNGAGKSSLLKILAGVTPPTRGRVALHGTVFPMIELNAGLHPDLPGRENVRLLGAIMGLTPAEVRTRMPEIESFCELGTWFDQPVRKYSSGMLARLGFSVAVNVDADVLLVDEVFGVGDLSFYNKCLRRMEQLRAAGKTFLFVSHNLPYLRRMCDRVLVLEQGQSLFVGDPGEGIERYEALLRSREARKAGDQSYDFVGASLERAQLIGPGRRSVEAIEPGEGATLELEFQLAAPLELVTLNVVVENSEAVPVIWETVDLPVLGAGQHTFALRWPDLRLKAGVYSVRLGLVVGAFPLKGFRASDALRFRMGGDLTNRGMYVPACEWNHATPKESAGIPAEALAAEPAGRAT